jgi:hypothetical protein
MMEVISATETSVNIYETTRCSISEDSYLHTGRREKLKSRPPCLCSDRVGRNLANLTMEKNMHISGALYKYLINNIKYRNK